MKPEQKEAVLHHRLWITAGIWMIAITLILLLLCLTALGQVAGPYYPNGGSGGGNTYIVTNNAYGSVIAFNGGFTNSTIGAAGSPTYFSLNGLHSEGLATPETQIRMSIPPGTYTNFFVNMTANPGGGLVFVILTNMGSTFAPQPVMTNVCLGNNVTPNVTDSFVIPTTNCYALILVTNSIASAQPYTCFWSIGYQVPTSVASVSVNEPTATNALLLNGIPASGFKIWVTNSAQFLALWNSLPVANNITNMPTWEFDLTNGIYQFTNSLTYTSGYPNNIVIKGEGTYSTMMLFYGTNKDFFHISTINANSGGADSNEMNGTIEGVAFGNWQDDTNYCFHIIGPGKWIFQNDNLFWAPSVVNNPIFGLGANDSASGQLGCGTNLCGIFLDGSGGTFCHIEDCNLNYLHQGVTFNSDHLTMINDWGVVGINSSGTQNFLGTTLWPTNSNQYFAGIVEFGGGSQLLDFTGFKIHDNGSFADFVINSVPQFESSIYEMIEESGNNTGNGPAFALIMNSTITNSASWSGVDPITFWGGYGVNPYHVNGAANAPATAAFTGTNLVPQILGKYAVRVIGGEDGGTYFYLPAQTKTPTNTLDDGNGNMTLGGNFAGHTLATYGTHTPGQVTVTASPFTFLNPQPYNLECYVSDAAAYSVTKNGVSILGSVASDGLINLQTNCVLILTYLSTAPTLYTNAW